MKLNRILLVAIASFGLAIPTAVAQRSANPPKSPTPNTGMIGGRMGGCMMQEMQVNSEFEYLTKMIPHHQEAVETAKVVLAHTERPEMQQFMEDIIQVQTAEIEQMQQWLNEWYPGQDTSVTYTPMMRDLNQLQGNELDQAFLEDMVMHHMGAVMMSRMLLNRDLVEHPSVGPFAEQIAVSQRQEIGQMRTWLQDWFGTTGGMGMMHQRGMMRGIQ
jgi:uncharacterized protein (DUF305 family)